MRPLTSSLAVRWNSREETEDLEMRQAFQLECLVEMEISACFVPECQDEKPQNYYPSLTPQDGIKNDRRMGFLCKLSKRVQRTQTVQMNYAFHFGTLMFKELKYCRD